MKIRYSIPFILLALLCCEKKSKAQDVSFSQVFSAPVYVNPALTGITGAGRFASLFQDQQLDLAGKYQTYYASYDQFVNKLKSGLGFFYMHDIYGLIKSNRFALAFSHGFDLMEKKLKIVPGLDADFVQQLLDTAGIITSQPETFNTKISYIDLAGGLHATTKRMNISAAAHHLTQPDESFIQGGSSRLPMRITVIADCVFGKVDEKKTFKFAPSFKMEMQNSIYNIQASFAMTYHKIKVGFAYKTSEDFIVQAAYQGSIFKLRYCYDFRTNKLSNKFEGIHEVTTLWNLFGKKRKDDFLQMHHFGF